jgi:hypothetical protein
VCAIALVFLGSILSWGLPVSRSVQYNLGLIQVG